MPAVGWAEVEPARPWRALDALDTATFTLPAGELPDTPESRGVFALPDGWEATGRQVGRLRDWSRPLPFPVDMPRPNYAPYGAQLRRGAEVVPYVSGSEDITTSGWWVERGEVHLLALEDPNRSPRRPELRVPELAAELAHRSYGAAGEPAADFVRVDATVGAVTRPSLHVPAPGRVGFPVAVPAGGRLDLGVAMLPDLLGRKGGDGATARVLVDGEEVWSAAVRPGDPFTDHRVDLARFAGRTVELALVTEPGATADQDHVVFSAPTVSAPLGRTPRRVVVVGIDTLRWDALGINGRARDTSPEIDAWAGDAVLFDRAYAPAPRTRPSFRTALTGRYPYDALATPTLATVFAGQGFRTAGMVGNVHLVPRFGFHEGTEHWYYENGARAGDQVERALAWLEAHREEDTFLFLHLMDPHTHYNAPLPWGLKFSEGRLSTRVPLLFDRWEIVNLTRRGLLDDNDKAIIRGRYDGEVAYTSHALGELFAGLDRLPGGAFTVLLSDHGEEFWDHGGFEHNHTLYDELVRVLLAMRPPAGWTGGPHRVDALVGLLDVAATLYDLVGVPFADRPPTDGLSLRPLVDAAAAAQAEPLKEILRDRPLVAGHLMFDTERWAVLTGPFKYILHTMSGREEVYDLVADPGEQHDLAPGLPPGRREALRAELARATGWPVGPAWRFSVEGRPAAPVVLEFDGPLAAGGVIDPEAGLVTRANLEWGEKPRLTPADVGDVSLSPDRTRAVFRPGRAAKGGTFYVACEGPCPDGVVVVGGDIRTPITPGGIPAAGAILRATAAPVIRPTRSEADAIGAVAGSGEMETLKALGYVAPEH